MFAKKTRTKSLWIAILIFSTLACRAATRLVIPDTPTPLPTATLTSTPTPTALPTFTPTVAFEAACSDQLSRILNSGSSTVILPGKRTEDLFKDRASIFLITYEVAKDRISVLPQIEPVPEALQDERNDRAAHKAIWDYFAAIIPPEEREALSEFSLFTDGRGNHLAAVSPMLSDPEQWALHVDILDAENHFDLTYTLIHEQGHLLTLDAEQVPPSKAIFKFPDNKTVYKQEVDACPQYFTGEGCSQPDSYINQFFDRFWPYIYAEWQQIDLEEDEDMQATMLRDFYKIYEDQFLSDYAPTSPVEDIAESWTYFILSPKPELDSIANEKILFFYEYPTLVELRTKILNNICAELPE